MKRIFTSFLAIVSAAATMAQGWPEQYQGVMLQGFSWDSYADTQWANIESQSDELAEYFSLIWVPNSGNCNSPYGLAYNKMGYTPIYYFDHNSSFGTEAQLRSMIATLKEKGVGVIEDAVINHRDNLGQNGSWVDYPAEEYDGVTYQMLPTDIVADDDNGATKTWADSQGIALSSNKDTGEGWDGCRDIDHKSQNVKTIIKAYLSYLLNDLGYVGFRYDMVKGFSPSYLGSYNYSANPAFSVGEYWDSNSAILSWIKGTKVNGDIQSAAFDFQFRYGIRDAVNQKNWTKLDQDNLLNVENGEYRRYSVTFAENHDQQDRGNVTNYTKDPIAADYIAAANAYLLAMPGTPCVFLPHWKSNKQDIKLQILARQLAGIHNQSDYTRLSSANGYYSAQVEGLTGSLIFVVGNKSDDFTPSVEHFTQVISGNHYRYYLSNNLECPWISVPSGDYEEDQLVELIALSSDANATLVYTLDGSEPSVANGEVVNSGTTVNIHEATILKVGLLKDGEVTNVQTRSYTITPFVRHTATVYVKADFTPVYFYVWDSDNNTQLNGNWPGTEITATTTIDGESWYYQVFDINSSGYYFNIIFNQGMDKPQTGDIGNISTDRFFIATLNGNSISYEDVSDQHAAPSAIEEITTDLKQSDCLYDLQGRHVTSMQPGHIYIRHDKKVIVK